MGAVRLAKRKPARRARAYVPGILPGLWQIADAREARFVNDGADGGNVLPVLPRLRCRREDRDAGGGRGRAGR